jgi:hypothetical protein
MPRKPKISIADQYMLGGNDRLKACRRALRETQHIHWKKRMDKINELLDLHGVEAIRGEWQNGYWCDIVATYCNSGDTYNMTVLHVRGDGWDESGKFFVGNWGDWFERNEKKYGLI